MTRRRSRGFLILFIGVVVLAAAIVTLYAIKHPNDLSLIVSLPVAGFLAGQAWEQEKHRGEG